MLAKSWLRSAFRLVVECDHTDAPPALLAGRRRCFSARPPTVFIELVSGFDGITTPVVTPVDGAC